MWCLLFQILSSYCNQKIDFTVALCGWHDVTRHTEAKIVPIQTVRRPRKEGVFRFRCSPVLPTMAVGRPVAIWEETHSVQHIHMASHSVTLL